MVDLCTRTYSSEPRKGGSELLKLSTSLKKFRDRYSGFKSKDTGYHVDLAVGEINKLIKDIEEKNSQWEERSYFEKFKDWRAGNEVNTAPYCLGVFFNRLAKTYVTGKVTTFGGGSRKYKKYKKKRKNNKKTKRRKPRSKIRSKKSKTKRIRKIR